MKQINRERKEEKNMNQQLWDECVKFHGHSCPGLAIGLEQLNLQWRKWANNFS